MMLFPQPRTMELLSGVYEMPLREVFEDLVSFFHAVRNGMPGISVISEALLGKEEYHMDIGAEGVEILQHKGPG